MTGPDDRKECMMLIYQVVCLKRDQAKSLEVPSFAHS